MILKQVWEATASTGFNTGGNRPVLVQVQEQAPSFKDQDSNTELNRIKYRNRNRYGYRNRTGTGRNETGTVQEQVHNLE